ncbi:hypothetical protein OMB55_00017700 [gamma proteobacterium HIMB55]|nr:hypothetical protein OMB55_00017700 [gamma proteobacterium HIMB55]
MSDLAVFKEQLHIDWTSMIGHPCELVIDTWDDGLSVVACTADGQMSLELSAVGDWLLNLEEAAVSEWLGFVPPGLRQSVMSLPSNRAALLQAASENKTVAELLISNPVLLWRLVDEEILDLAELDHATLELKQTELCKLLGLKGSTQQVKLIRKAANGGLSKGATRAFLSLLEIDQVCTFFSHQAEIAEAKITLINKHPWLVSHPIRSLIDELKDAETRRIFDDVLRMLDDISSLMRCKTVRALMRLHDRLVAELNARHDRNLVRDVAGNLLPFKAPPLVGSEHIEPIEDQLDLLREGREMGHCISSYLTSVLAGDYCVYRMLEPQRLTIGIVITAWGQCYLKEVRGKGNSMPSDEAMGIVTSWFFANEPDTSDGLPKIYPQHQG